MGFAVKLAGRYGIHRTAKALRVDYYSLKKRVEGDAVTAGTQQEPAAIASKAPAATAEAKFLELPAATALAAHQLQILLSAGNPEATQAAPAWRPVGPVD